MKTFVFLLVFIFQATALFASMERIGTTFSQVQCEYLDQDPERTYLEVLSLGLDIIRIGTYWSQIEEEKNVYDFSFLDWQIEQAKQKNIPVVLTVGMKSPRWPEYFIPNWVLSKESLSYGEDVSKNSFLRKRALLFIEKVVRRYKDESIIKYWQVENEPLNRYGGKSWFIGREFLKQEIELVRKIDQSKRPIVLTAATYPNSFLRFIAKLSVRHDPIKECLNLCDILGVNIYPVVGHKVLGLRFHFKTDRKVRERYFSKLLERVKKSNKDIWILELQAEPWEPGHLVYTKEKRSKTASPYELFETISEFENLGFDTIFLWGAEYWLYRRANFKDNAWIKALNKAKMLNIK